MASTLSLRLLCLHSLQDNPSFKSLTLTTKVNCFAGIRNVPKSSPRKSTITSRESPSQEPTPPQNSSSLQRRRFRNGWLNFDELGMEILSIALPAALGLAADPLTSLIGTAFLGHLGSVELAAVGVSISVFNLVSKLFNVPLLNITTSFVAEEQVLISKGDDASRPDDDFLGKHQSKKLIPSVSTSVALAASLGIAEAVALSLGSGILINIMGFTHACTC